MAKEYIEREAVLKETFQAQESLETNNDKMWRINKPIYKGLAWANAIIIETPAADVVEVVRGVWKMAVDEADYEYGTCSECGFREWYAFLTRRIPNYCPNCGAKMDGGKRYGEM